jgi:signal transduction histidine kinase
VQSLIGITALLAAFFFLGISLRTRQAYLAALVERATRLEHERDQQARIAAAAERASIAREMHDIVAHSLAVIITMADAAAAKRRSDPERAGAAMEQVSEVGRQALGETRRLLGVLRTEAPGGGSAPLPGLAQLDALLDKVRATGLAAELTVTGRRFAVPEGAQLAAYRIVQEALTNTIKHARGATRVQVWLRYADPVIEVDVADDGRPAPGQSDVTGHGLAGMSERAALYDGTVLAGPGAGGGWAVSARLSLAGLARPAAS